MDAEHREDELEQDQKLDTSNRRLSSTFWLKVAAFALLIYQAARASVHAMRYSRMEKKQKNKNDTSKKDLRKK